MARKPYLLTEHYASLAEMVNTANDRVQPSTKKEGGDGWAGGSWETACKLATNGWDAKASDVQASIESVGDLPTLSPYYEVAGDEVDVPMMLEGIPEHMVSYPFQPKSRPMVTVYVNCGYSSGVETQAVERFGLAIVGGIEALRLSGHTVKVVGAFGMSGSGWGDKRGHACISVDLADTRFAYDATQVVYAIAHPTFLRRLLFGIQDGWSKEDKDRFGVPPQGWGRGMPHDIATDPIRPYLQEKDEFDDDSTVFFPLLDSSYNRWSQEKFDEMVREILNP